MGCMGSCVEKIRGFRFQPFPALRVLKSLSIVRIDRCLYAVGPGAAVYTNSELAGKVCFVGSGENYHAVRALKALGLITAEETRIHGTEKAKRDKAFADYRAVRCELEVLTEAGIKLTKGQKATLKKMQSRLDDKNLPRFVTPDEVKKARAKKLD